MSIEKYTDEVCCEIENEAMYAEIKRLRAALRNSNDLYQRLRALVLVAQPEMERIEFAEASADDCCGTRLRTLRQWLVNARKVLEET